MARKTRNQRRTNSGSPSASTSFLTKTFGHHRPGFDRVLFVLALAGLLVTIHLGIQQSRGFDQGCWGFNPPDGGAETFNCSAVVQSGAGSILGISNVYWGMMFYGALALLGWLVLKASMPRLQLWNTLRAGIIGFGFIYSMYLVNYQFNSIGELCALCLTSAGIATTLFLVQLARIFTKPPGENTISFEMPKEARLYSGLALAVVVLAGADYLYFQNLGEPATQSSNQVAADALNNSSAVQPASGAASSCEYDTNIPVFADFETLVRENDPMKGNPDSKVAVFEFFDPNCPHCQDFHPVMKEIIAANEDRARFYYMPYPIRDFSVPQIEAMYVAHEDGKFFDMLDAQIALKRTSGISLSELRNMARDLGIDTEKMNSRLRGGLYRQVLIQRYQKVSELGISSVPTVMVNGRVVISRSPDCFDQYITSAAG